MVSWFEFDNVFTKMQIQKLDCNSSLKFIKIFYDRIIFAEVKV